MKNQSGKKRKEITRVKRSEKYCILNAANNATSFRVPATSLPFFVGDRPPPRTRATRHRIEPPPARVNVISDG